MVSHDSTELACAFKALANSKFDVVIFTVSLSFDDGEQHVYAIASGGSTHSYDRGTLLANDWVYSKKHATWKKQLT